MNQEIQAVQPDTTPLNTVQTNAKVPDQSSLTNEAIAARFERIAELLEAQNANPYRVGAYRGAAKTLRELHVPAVRILQQEGVAGLRKLPGIGESLARSILQLAGNGTLGLLEQLQGEVEAEQILSTVAGIGPKLAERIHEQLGIETLRDLYAAAVDGRLGQVPGFGAVRQRAVRETLQGRLPMLQQARYIASDKTMPAEPSVEELLDVDAEYRSKVERNLLPRIAPRRFNPSNTAWLPILHTQRASNEYTALFSNTKRAHDLNQQRNWVVIYRDEVSGGGQWTVVTQPTGRLATQRVVRGRERECELLYATRGVIEGSQDKQVSSGNQNNERASTHVDSAPHDSHDPRQSLSQQPDTA